MFKRNKNGRFDYTKAVMDISREIRNKNLEACDPNNGSPIQKLFLVYNLKDMNKLLHTTSVITRKLLSDKGFTLSIEDRVEKSVLLNTEISELADAVKKGLGKEAEGSEVADIIIRASNFLCLDETYHNYQKLSNVLIRSAENTDTVSVAASISGYSDKVKDKYLLIEDMMRCWVEIKDASEMVEICYSEKLGEEKFNTAFIILWNKIIDLSAYCSAYVTLYLPQNLQYYINDKMNKNFERPYKYGTYEEVK